MVIPIPPIDSRGVVINVGDIVHIPIIPDWLVGGLPLEDIEELRKIEGCTMRILEIDQFGYLWFGSETGGPWFCLRPSDVASVDAQ